MQCPVCGKINTDNWPLTVGGEIKAGGCQGCWEKECNDSWWKAVETVGQINLDKKNNAADPI